MKTKIKPGAKFALAGLLVALFFGVKWLVVDSELIFAK